MPRVFISSASASIDIEGKLVPPGLCYRKAGEKERGRKKDRREGGKRRGLEGGRKRRGELKVSESYKTPFIKGNTVTV